LHDSYPLLRTHPPPPPVQVKYDILFTQPLTYWVRAKAIFFVMPGMVETDLLYSEDCTPTILQKETHYFRTVPFKPIEQFSNSNKILFFRFFTKLQEEITHVLEKLLTCFIHSFVKLCRGRNVERCSISCLFFDCLQEARDELNQALHVNHPLQGTIN
jgi:hypothetical protein